MPDFIVIQMSRVNSEKGYLIEKTNVLTEHHPYLIFLLTRATCSIDWSQRIQCEIQNLLSVINLFASYATMTNHH